MGIITATFRNLRPAATPITSVGMLGGSGGIVNYQSAVRDGYMRNDLVRDAVELLATSAAEPRIIGRRYRNTNTRRQARQQANMLLATGMPRWAIAEILNRQLLQEEFDERGHPLVKILNNPNPVTTRFHLYSTLIMDYYLAGNAYLLKARGGLGNTAELWRLRPDRVRVETDEQGRKTGYTYTVGRDVQRFPAEDVIHWKTRNPLDDHYGMPPLMPLSGHIAIDNFMTDFIQSYFRSGGQPGAILTLKQRMSQEAKDEIRNRMRARFSGPGGWFDTLILDQAESTYTPMTQNMGARGMVMPELTNITEARIWAAFGIPASIGGSLVGLEKSSYANKKQDWQVLWDITLAPLYSDLDDQLNLDLTPEFGNIDEVLFDLSQVKALQEDVDKLHERARRNVTAGIWPIEYAAMLTGVDLTAIEGTMLLPSNAVQVPVAQLGAPLPEPQQALQAIQAMFAPTPVMAEIAAPEIVAEAQCPECGKFLGRNVNIGAALWCRSCRAEKVLTT